MLKDAEICEIITQDESDSEHENDDITVGSTFSGFPSNHAMDDDSDDETTINSSPMDVDDSNHDSSNPDLNNVFNFDPGNLKWSHIRKRPTPHPFSVTNAGYQSTLTAEYREVDFSKDIFDSALVDSIVLQTNNYQEYVGDNLFRCGEFSAINKWKNVSPGELYLFLATWLLVGIHGLNKMKDCWSTRDILHVP